LAKISKSNRSDVEKLIDYLNYELECVLRPRSAPLRYAKSGSSGAPRLYTDRRAQSARRRGSSSRNGYPTVYLDNSRAKSAERRGRQHHPHLALTPDVRYGGEAESAASSRR